MMISWLIFRCLLSLLLAILITVVQCQQQSCEIYNADGTLRQYKTLIFLSKDYFNLFHNWLIHYRSICDHDDHLELVCLDKGIKSSLETVGLTCSDRFSTINFRLLSVSRTEVWLQRMKAMIQLLEEGVDVFVSDIDAIWLKSPFPDLNTLLPTSQIVSSRGSFPKDLSGAWGFTLCMGFIYIQASPMSLTLFRHVLHHMLTTEGGNKGDDQYSINEVLFNMNIRWKHGKYERQQELNVGQVVFSKIHRAVIYDNSTEKSNNTHPKIVTTKTLSPYNVSVLPDHRYLRRCVHVTGRKTDALKEKDFTPVVLASLKRRLEHAVVAHCLIMTSTPIKERYLQTYSLWKAPKQDLLFPFPASPTPLPPSAAASSAPSRISPSTRPPRTIVESKRTRQWAYDARSDLVISTGPANDTAVKPQVNVDVSIRHSSSVVETLTIKTLTQPERRNRAISRQREAYLRELNEKRKRAEATGQHTSTDTVSSGYTSAAKRHQQRNNDKKVFSKEKERRSPCRSCQTRS
eukprot:gene6296-6942_t